MDTGKYIIVEVRGCELAILFDAIISHDSFLKIYDKDRILSAGFFAVGAELTDKDEQDISVSVYGKSTTLTGLKSREIDAVYIKKVLRHDFSH